MLYAGLDPAPEHFPRWPKTNQTLARLLSDELLGGEDGKFIELQGEREVSGVIESFLESNGKKTKENRKRKKTKQLALSSRKRSS